MLWDPETSADVASTRHAEIANDKLRPRERRLSATMNSGSNSLDVANNLRMVRENIHSRAQDRDLVIDAWFGVSRSRSGGVLKSRGEQQMFH